MVLGAKLTHDFLSEFIPLAESVGNVASGALNYEILNIPGQCAWLTKVLLTIPQTHRAGDLIDSQGFPNQY